MSYSAINEFPINGFKRYNYLLWLACPFLPASNLALYTHSGDSDPVTLDQALLSLDDMVLPSRLEHIKDPPLHARLNLMLLILLDVRDIPFICDLLELVRDLLAGIVRDVCAVGSDQEEFRVGIVEEGGRINRMPSQGADLALY